MIPSYLSSDRGDLETLSRQHCHAVRLSERFVICRVLGKYILYADPEDVGLTPHLCLDGFWESWVTIAMARLLQPGWHCVDVGANHGYYTMIMADAVEPSGRVMAIEPNPQLANLVKLSLEVNGYLPHASVLQRAAADLDSKKISLIVPRHRAMDATLFREATASDEVFEVETITVDRATADWRGAYRARFDAQGAEELIWRGMRETLERHPAITIIMEMRCSRYAEPRAFVRDIQRAGFPLRHIDYDGSIKRVTAEQVLNDRLDEDWMLFLRRD